MIVSRRLRAAGSAAAMTWALAGCSSSGGPGATSGTPGPSGSGASAGASSSGSTGSAGTTTSGAASGSPSSGSVTMPSAGSSTGASAGATSGSSSGSGASAGATGSSGSVPDASAASGTASDAGGGLVPPIARGNLDVFQFGNTNFSVDGTQGARITEFSIDGTNVLTGSTVNAQFWGSTFWTAPQGDWWTGMVPTNYAPIDYAPYMMSVGADSSVDAVGGTATFATPMKEVAVSKTFAADPTTSSVDITYTMTNKGTASIKIGHWEVTRVFPGGLTFYPGGAAAPMSYGPITLSKMGGYLWFDESKFPTGTAGKTWGDVPTGSSWIAHVVPDPAGPLVLIRTFPDIPAGSAGAGDGAVEIFVGAVPNYEEIELHNSLLTLTAGESAPWKVRWYLRRMPMGTMVTVGNQALVDFVTQTIQ